MTFKEKLVILRKSKNLTQDEFASAVGVTRQAVYKWESGQSYPEVPKLLEMKQLFSISIDELLDDNHDIPLPEKKKRKRTPKDATATPKAAPAAKPAKTPAPKAEPTPVVRPATPVAQPAPAPKAEPVVTAAPAPKAEPVVKASPVAQPAVKAAPIAQPAPAPAPKAEPVAKPEPKIDSVPGPTEIEINDLKEADESTKKTSFFDRLFGRK
jgi:transcriptional regulator with XRE-family HTH domain